VDGTGGMDSSSGGMDGSSGGASSGGASSGGASSGGASSGGASSGGDVGSGGEEAGSGGEEAGSGGEEAGSGGEEAGSGGEEGSGDACGTISAVVPTDEDHMLTVTNMDIAEGVDKTYSIQGVSGHNHEVTITAADFVTLAETGSLALTSTETFSHDHIVNVTCEA
jgi:hypothetical protein